MAMAKGKFPNIEINYLYYCQPLSFAWTNTPAYYIICPLSYITRLKYFIALAPDQP